MIHLAKGKKIEYQDFLALKELTLEVSDGETLGIIGHNGAGKSTLLKVIARVIRPQEGEVYAKGTIAPLIELGAGFDPELTGKENIYLNASILGFSRKETDSKFDSIVEFSELSEFIYSPLKSYSAGMVSRLGFSIATEVDPDILIIDEILAVGDEHFKRKCNQKILSFKARGTTMLLVSHDMDEIRKLCDRVLWLEQGALRMCGQADHVTDEYLKAV
ncbi:MAG TPA: ABC transporter ATP-binding protein [Thermodesulfovibrionales bacterium]|nr:ABC transporter ATP-binding protein [Thermodesulfovibrionales bacterium]